MTITIVDWISTGRDYKSGIEILRSKGISHSLLILLEQGENTFTRKKLNEEIEKLQKKPSTSFQEVDKPETLKGPAREEDPKEIQDLVDERQKLYRSNDFIWSRIDPDMDQGQRGIACLQILKNRKRIREIYSLLDYYNQFGELPSIAEEKKSKSLYELQKELNNARANKSKNKSRGKPDKVALYSKKIEEIELEIESLKNGRT